MQLSPLLLQRLRTDADGTKTRVVAAAADADVTKTPVVAAAVDHQILAAAVATAIAAADAVNAHSATVFMGGP